MQDNTASAKPRKWFFVEMFTRDISLIDCILDLVDNSVDGLIRKDKIIFNDNFYSPELILTLREKESLPIINIQYTDKLFKIEDNCGGIPLKEAQNEVFNFGHEFNELDKNKKISLGVYGIGLKRALFKIGDSFEIHSKSKNDGFVVSVQSIKDWMKSDNTIDDWSFPLQVSNPSVNDAKAGTSIIIKKFSDEVKHALSDGEFSGKLIKSIANVYGLFLERYVRIILNNQIIEPINIPFGKSQEIEPANKKFDFNEVSVQLIASVAARQEKNQWANELAGWYVACNGRLIVVADKSDLTGWGGGSLPQFHSKYRGFVGLALFQSSNPMKLPWKTTKQGLNQESLVYQNIRNQMRLISRPILTFLDKMYPSDPIESLNERKIVNNVTAVDVRTLKSSIQSDFAVNQTKQKKIKTTVHIKYEAEIDLVEAIRKHERNPKLSANEVGKMTFDYYLTSNAIK